MASDKKYEQVLWFYTVIILLFIGTAFVIQSYQDRRSSETVAEVADKRVALTFDDGPTRYTSELLDGLRERGVHVTFFILGQNIALYEKTLQREQQEGHLIGNHTYNHVQLTAISEAAAVEQIRKTSNAIFEVTGVYTTFVRPPYGLWKKDFEYHVTMLPVFWDVDSQDWKTTDVGATVRRVRAEVEPGDIILMHDISESSVASALQIIDELVAEGYRFVTVDELVFE